MVEYPYGDESNALFIFQKRWTILKGELTRNALNGLHLSLAYQHVIGLMYSIKGLNNILMIFLPLSLLPYPVHLPLTNAQNFTNQEAMRTR